jgi:uncharacterized membrane protein
MKTFFTLAFLFSLGSVLGWIIELLFKRFFLLSNTKGKWINPGFLRGPYLPIYGFSLCILYYFSKIKLSFIHNLVLQHLALFLVTAIIITIMEYIIGIILIKGMKVKLWDYSKLKGNFQGIICPQFTFFWFLLSFFYYVFLDNFMDISILWIMQNLGFTFILGFFYGILIVDVFYSIHILAKIKKFAQTHKIIVRYENLKTNIAKYNEELAEKANFFFFFKAEPHELAESIKKYIEKEREFLKDMIK